MSLAQRYNYVSNIIPDPARQWDAIREKSVIPHQVEVQPGPLMGPICWMKCPYCYGGAASDSGERLLPKRYVEIMHELAIGGVPKVVFAGYATDPLNYSHIHDLVKVAVDAGQIVGFHTKALKLDEVLIKLLAERRGAAKSYFSVSVDAGTDKIYNRVHGIKNLKSRSLTRVLSNISELTRRRRQYRNNIDISATYLVNHLNCGRDEMLTSIQKLREAGVDLIRFTFPQMPRGGGEDLVSYVPDRLTVETMMAELTDLVKQENSEICQVVVLDMDKELGTVDLPRTTPCFARYIFPTIGFDGWLYHCSESASPDFRELALGNLSTSNFWDCYYGYENRNLENEFLMACKKMSRAECKCDRKEHVVNSVLKPQIDSTFKGVNWAVNL